MTYLELQREVKRRQQALMQTEETAKEMQVCVISDMPLQPWFELYLQKAWAEKGRIVRTGRLDWAQRNQAAEEAEVRLYWPSSEVAAEIDPEGEASGIWISTETASDPIRLFYSQTLKMQEAERYPANDPVIDLEKLMLRVGLEGSLADREKRWGDRYSRRLQEAAAYEAVRVYETRHGRRKKCLVLDCDGVLWGGIVSEDGPEGLILSETGKGKTYRQFQALVKRLQEHGILLAICSKNEEADVRAVFNSHTAMKLREEDIAAWSVGWQPKSVQMAELAEKLQIDPQDMVMVDDNQWELEEVRSRYPQVSGILFDLSRGERRIYEKLAEQFLLTPEDENRQNQLRVQTYADNVKRAELRQAAGSYDEFLKRLQTRMTLQPATASDLPRISDLSRRANQCTNGARYTVEELKQQLQEGYQLQAVFVSDIYRDLGLVGCVGIRPDSGLLDLFCLSCRALGRGLEQQLLAALPPEINRLRWADTGKNAALWQTMQQERRWQNEA